MTTSEFCAEVLESFCSDVDKTVNQKQLEDAAEMGGKGGRKGGGAAVEELVNGLKLKNNGTRTVSL